MRSAPIPPAVLMEHAGVNYALTLPVAGLVCFVAGFLFGQPALRLSRRLSGPCDLRAGGGDAATAEARHLRTLDRRRAGPGGDQAGGAVRPSGSKCRRTRGCTTSRWRSRSGSTSLSVNLLQSRSGRAFMAIRDNEIAASAMGVGRRAVQNAGVRCLRRHHRRCRRPRRHRGAVRGARRLHHQARDLAVPRHGGRRRRLAAGIARGCGLHHLRAQYRRAHLEGPLGRRVRRAAVRRDLPRCRMARGKLRLLLAQSLDEQSLRKH